MLMATAFPSILNHN